jgi:acetyl-CoA carboxylase carboxyl transferase subunit alpha
MPLGIVGIQKGRDTKENVYRNFGMAQPEGYRKALRFMNLCARFGLPILSMVDTAGAYPGIEGEERSVAEAIAKNLFEMSHLPVPIVVVVIGEGGSGGALGIGVGDRVLMQANAFYSVISPEACATILWRDLSRAEEAAAALKGSADQLLKFGIIDEIIPEPLGGAHQDTEAAMATLKEAVLRHLRELVAMDATARTDARYAKFRAMGEWNQVSAAGLDKAGA